MKYILLFLSLFFLNACTVVLPHISEYKIALHEEKVPLDATTCKDKSLKVSQAFSANSLMSEQMKYTLDEYKEYAFSESKWSRSPNRAITDALTKSIRASKLFQSVQGYKSRSKSDYIFESNIEEFMQYFTNDAKSSYVRVVISLSLIDAKSGKTLQSHEISKRVDVEELNAEGGAKALSKALNVILVENKLWLNEVCR